MKPYIGRFAPSPTGPLHAGSLVAALASYLDALVHGGQWLLRIDDADLTRSKTGCAATIAAQLQHYGFECSGKPTHTQDFRAVHRLAFNELFNAGRLYACNCSRAQLTNSPLTQHSQERVYSGTCKHSQLVMNSPECRAVRINVEGAQIAFTDRWAGPQTEHLAIAVGDFVIWRPEHLVQVAGGLFNYQLTMPCDDAAQGVTHVVRGADLLTSTARQIYVYDCLNLQKPNYLHVPLVLKPDGLKLSKQNHAAPLPSTDPLPELERALQHLGCGATQAVNPSAFWRSASAKWAQRLQEKTI